MSAAEATLPMVQEHLEIYGRQIKRAAESVDEGDPDRVRETLEEMAAVATSLFHAFRRLDKGYREAVYQGRPRNLRREAMTAELYRRWLSFAEETIRLIERELGPVDAIGFAGELVAGREEALEILEQGEWHMLAEHSRQKRYADESEAW